MTKEQLSNRIWITKKARQNAESRLIKTDNIFSFLLVYYSVAFAAFQLFSKFIDMNSVEAHKLDWISTTFSLFILVFSLVVAGYNFKLQAERMKSSYLDLTDLEYQVSFGKPLNEAAAKYSEILKRSDNHLGWDFERIFLLRKIDSNETDLMVISRHAKHVLIFLIVWLMGISMFLLPIFIFLNYLIKYL
ncbi:SLATT domain-containing protein [Bdellovibrio bacteriovorus]|uniref:SLATT domain-containing protein n=1 Tax=Bdellovibrio bacteriovorus TaxID=959 RepID=UPI0035A6C593